MLAHTAYAILVKLVNIVGWEALLEYRARAFWMQDDYQQFVQTERANVPPATSQATVAEPSRAVTTAVKPHAVTATTGEGAAQYAAPPTPVSAASSSSLPESPDETYDRRRSDVEASAARLSATELRREPDPTADAKAPTLRVTSGSAEALPRPAPPVAENKDVQRLRVDTVAAVGRTLSSQSARSPSFRPGLVRRDSGVMVWAVRRVWKIGATDLPDLAARLSKHILPQARAEAAPLSPLPRAGTQPQTPVAAGQDRRVAAAWLDELFMVIFNDLRTYMGVFPEEDEARRRRTLEALPLTAADLRLLGDLARRLGRHVRSAPFACERAWSALNHKLACLLLASRDCSRRPSWPTRCRSKSGTTGGRGCRCCTTPSARPSGTRCVEFGRCCDGMRGNQLT